MTRARSRFKNEARIAAVDARGRGQTNMRIKRLLIANRGEVAIRIARTAAELGMTSVAIYSEDDRRALHTRLADEAVALQGSGPAAYLDAAQIVARATAAGCEAVHPGYGFLSENAGFARECEEGGLIFVGPRAATLDLFGDKAAARRFAETCGVPVIDGTAGATTLEEARAFLAALGPGGAVMVKALAGGGGRGMRAVSDLDQLATAFERCRAEALQAFGNGSLYVERLFPRARHVEVQIAGDGTGDVVHLWERECSVQRERQKIIEIAPAPRLHDAVRARLLRAATALAAAAGYRGLGTVEFLVDAADESADAPFAFIEANARLQVEHTVTEEITGLDLVRIQLEIAQGARLAEIGLRQADVPAPRGIAIEARVNLESMGPDGGVRPTGGVLSVYEPPSGHGVRVDGYGYGGYRTNPRFDSLLAKVIAHAASGRVEDAAAKARRALSEFRVSGVPTNIPFLQSVLRHPDFLAGAVHTRFVEERAATLVAGAAQSARRWFEPAGADAAATRLAGAKVDPLDPLAVVRYGKEARGPEADEGEVAADIAGPEGTVALRAPMQGTVVSLAVGEGDAVRAGQEVLVMEAMKMQHGVAAETGGIVRAVEVVAGDTVFEGAALLFIEPAEVAGGSESAAHEIDPDHIRPDLAAVLERARRTTDAARPTAVERRRATRQRTARENIADLVDPGSFVEYGRMVVAARRTIRTLEQLIEEAPADGLIMGLATINGAQFPEEKSRAVVVSYDYTVYAGTQGRMGHIKQDRMFELAERLRLPVVLFAEGGGGRGSDTDPGISAVETETFHKFPRLSGLVPLVGIAAGRCFAGNAVLLGCCDVIIATENSTIGMAGPAMIEGGGLGVFRPEEVGPMRVQVPNGVVDILVRDEEEAVAVAKKYLSYFQGRVAAWSCADQRRLRHIVPEDRLRGYDMREVIRTLADEGSMLEIRSGFGHGMITALIRVEGRPLGVIANNPRHLGGAIDADAADKAARFMQLCDAHDIPLLSLNDNPGNMVGPEAEKTALVRHCCRAYLVGANLGIPVFLVCVRKSYGLGKLAMIGGGMRLGVFSIAWPTGEFGGMGLEGQVKLGRRKELEAIADPAERRAAYERMVAELYERGRAINQATGFGVDDVIDPAETRRWIVAGLRSLPPAPLRTEKRRPCVDGW
ncbi:MAG TPA: carboxyl transferase domain-containing protein [Acetobacteraceae bacterium]|nr:carboxyl transferase domain-containing protein [Acetobacteraceae bacterium]